MNQAKDLYAVMGNPIAHSKSPFIHSQFAKQTQQAVEYTALLVPLDEFEQSVKRFQQAGGKGLNVTVPFKQQAWQLVNERSERAELAGAVNTMTLRGDRLLGDNTDGVGIVRDLQQNHHIALKNKRILILGAGGAVRGVIGPILFEKPQRLHLANRTVERATELVDIFAQHGNISASGFDELRSTDAFDIIINGTAASLQNALPPVPGSLIKNTVCYDMMYGREPTVFLKWALAHGAKQAIDGLGMLVEQAAESFYIWRGVKPETAPVINALRENLMKG